MIKKIIGTFLFLLILCAGFAQTTDKKLFNKRYIKSLMTQVTNWQLANPKHNPRDWTNGAFYAGVFATWETTRSKAIYKSMMDMGNTANWLPYKRSYHADDVTICQTYIDLYRKEKRMEMIQPSIDSIKRFVENPYPTKGKVDVIKWWWCDALFMAPPTMVKFGMTTGNAEFLSRNDQYYKECYDLLFDKKEHLFARDLNYVIQPDGKGPREANGEKIFWSRGNGWVMGGLVRILKELPSTYTHRPFYEELFQEMATRILNLQRPDGLWRASLLDPASYPGGEVSGSGFFCYALAWGINNKLLDKKTFLPAVEKTWVSLTACVNQEGRVGWVQPVGGAPKRNINAESWEVYGTGALLLAASEVIKLRR